MIDEVEWYCLDCGEYFEAPTHEGRFFDTQLCPTCDSDNTEMTCP